MHVITTHRHAHCVSCRAEAEYSNAATQQEAERAEKAIKSAVAALKVSSRTKKGRLSRITEIRHTVPLQLCTPFLTCQLQHALSQSALDTSSYVVAVILLCHRKR